MDEKVTVYFRTLQSFNYIDSDIAMNPFIKWLTCFVLAFVQKAIRARGQQPYPNKWKSLSNKGQKPLLPSMLRCLFQYILPNRMWGECWLPRSLTEGFKLAFTQADTHTDWTQGTDIVKVELEANEILLTFTTRIVREREKESSSIHHICRG